MTEDMSLQAGDTSVEKRPEAVPTEGTAGDAIVETRTDASDVAIATPEAQINTAAPIVVPDVSDVEDETVPKFDGLRCATCREVKKDDQLMKQPLEYIQKADGSLRVRRYSLFCGKCQQFLCIYDPVAAKEVRDMINNRNELSKKANG